MGQIGQPVRREPLQVPDEPLTAPAPPPSPAQPTPAPVPEREPVLVP